MRNAHKTKSTKVQNPIEPVIGFRTPPVSVPVDRTKGVVKVGVAVNGHFVETVYVALKQASPKKLTGRVVSDPWFPQAHHLKSGQELSFERDKVESFHPNATFHGAAFYLS